LAWKRSARPCSIISTAADGSSRLSLSKSRAKRSNNRPQLAAALAACKKQKAKLVIAKLDRLARNVHFISGLMEAGVEFVACDMPHANKCAFWRG
jgi:hypothetical protein